MTTQADLRHYMKQMATLRRPLTPKKLPYAGLEDFLLQEGEPFDPLPCETYIRLGTPKECFANASRYVLDHSSFRYAEGLILLPSLPIAIHHAWVVNLSGLAVDVTLKWEANAAYYGVIFQTLDLSRRLLKQQTYGLFDDGVGYTDLIKGTDPHFSYRRSHEIARTA